MTSPLELVSEHFPHLRERVAHLYRTDEIFRELCEDYQSCLGAQAAQSTREDIRREYGALQLRLEGELLRHVQETGLRPVPK